MTQPDFNQVCNQFRQFRAILGQALAGSGDAAVKQHLQAVTATLDQNFAELQTVYPNALAAIDAQLAGVHQSAEQTAAQLAEMREAIAAAKVEIAPATPPAAPIDPALGQQLRKELLERFGQPTIVEDAHASAQREIWQDWDGQNWSNN